MAMLKLNKAGYAWFMCRSWRSLFMELREAKMSYLEYRRPLCDV